MAKRPCTKISRRTFIQNCALSASALGSIPILGCRETAGMKGSFPQGAANRTISLDDQWLFGGKFYPAALAPGFQDGAFSRVTVPHCVSKLSWQKWDPATWEDLWIYRRHFALPSDLQGLRVFLRFDGVMVGATPAINGQPLPKHVGGYLPFEYELTEWLIPDDNVLAVTVDSRWTNVPPEGSPKGPKSIDYLEPGGVFRSVRIEAVPQVFISDLFAKPVQVLDPARRIDVTCSIDAATVPAKPIRLQLELRDSGRIVARTEQSHRLVQKGQRKIEMTLSRLGNISLWSPDTPHLYEVVATLLVEGRRVHDYRARIGFRNARFEPDGFFLNGQRFRLFGLNRHELYPYVGGGMPGRVLRRDAEILRRQFNCNIVRCSHYPQSKAFLDACDELGLMVWEETPGWQYLGDDAWKALVVRNVKNMVRRDRNRPSVVIWGVRVNESNNDPELYRRTSEAAKALDDSRPTSGSMTPDSIKTWRTEWKEDVFAFDDYHSAPDGSVGIKEPLPGVPYMLSEAVGQFSYGHGKGGFNNKYRRAGDLTLQTQQALFHAQAHNKAAAFPRCAGVIAWCGFDYGSLVNSYNAVKCPGVADVFRIPKLGASFYQAQVSPKVRPVIQPNFYWDFGPKMPRGPGKDAAIFSNCDRLELFVDGTPFANVAPDRGNFSHLEYPPFFHDLGFEAPTPRELRIDGYVGNSLVLSKSFSADASQDQLLLRADDNELVNDGSDATRVEFQVVDKFGEGWRPFAGGEILFEVTGPGEIVGDNPFSSAESGGVGAVWIRSITNRSGKILVKATHSTLGTKSVEILSRSLS